MKKIMLFFIGLFILITTGGLLYFTSVIFDTTDKIEVSSFIFQPNNMSEQRVDNPIPASDISELVLRDRLIRNFVFEYFYVLPDDKNIQIRTQNNSPLSIITTPAIFKEWKSTVANEIKTMSQNKVYRLARVSSEIVQNGDYLEVPYELKTWVESNDMNYKPEITNDVFFIKISFENQFRDTLNGQEFNIQKYLDSGKNPAAIFRFRVDELKEQKI